MSELMEKTGKTRKPLRKHLDYLIKKEQVVKDGTRYYFYQKHHLKKMKEELEAESASLLTYKVDPYELNRHLQTKYKNDEKIRTIPSEMDLWSLGLITNIWNPKMEQVVELDFEVFLAVQQLVYIILKKIKIEKINDMKMMLNIHFDPLFGATMKLNHFKNLEDEGFNLIKEIQIKAYEFALNKIIEDAKKVKLNY